MLEQISLMCTYAWLLVQQEREVCSRRRWLRVGGKNSRESGNEHGTSNTDKWPLLGRDC